MSEVQALLQRELKEILSTILDISAFNDDLCDKLSKAVVKTIENIFDEKITMISNHVIGVGAREQRNCETIIRIIGRSQDKKLDRTSLVQATGGRMKASDLNKLTRLLEITGKLKISIIKSRGKKPTMVYELI